MANTPCPNKNLPEWKLLVNNLGEDEAYRIFIANGYEVPKQNTVESIISTYKVSISSDPGEEGFLEEPTDVQNRIFLLTPEELLDYKFKNYDGAIISENKGVYSKGDIVNIISQEDPELYQIYNHFRDIIPIEPAVFFNNEGKVEYHSNNYINIDLSVIQSLADLSNRSFEQVLSEAFIHEYAHAVTVMALESSAEFRREVRDIMKEFIKADKHNQFFDELRMGYRSNGATYQYNIYEFVADLYSNRSFKEYLKSNKEHRSLLRRILDAIRKFLGLNVKEPNNKSLYDRAMDVMTSNTAIMTKTFESSIQNTYRFSPLVKGRKGLDAHFTIEEKYNRINLVSSVINSELSALLEQGEVNLKSEEEVFDSISRDMKGFKDRIFNILVDTQNKFLENNVSDSVLDSYLKVLDFFEDFSEGEITYPGLFKHALRQLSGRGIAFREQIEEEGLDASDGIINMESEDQLVTNGDRTTETNWSQTSLEKDYKDTISTKVRQAIRDLDVLEYQYLKNDDGEEVKVINPLTDDLMFPVKVLSNENRWIRMIQEAVKDSITFSSMMSKLNKLASSQPTINKLIEKINFDSDFASAFFYSFAKAKVDYISVKKFTQDEEIQGEEGVITYNRYRVLSSNRNNIYSELLDRWSSNLKIAGGSNITKLVDGKVEINTDIASIFYNEYDEIIKNIDNNFTFKDAAAIATIVNQFGIDITGGDIISQFVDSKEYSEGTLYNRTPVQTLKGFLGNLRTILKDISKGNNPFDTESDWKNIVRNFTMEVAISRSDMLNDNFLNADNKPMYSYITPNYLTKTFSILKSNNYNQFLDKYRDDPFYESSWLLNELSEGKNRDLLKFKIFDGLFNNPLSPKGNRYSDISDRDLEIIKFNSFINPVSDGKKSKEGSTAYYMSPILSDAPNSIFIEYKKFEPGEIIENLFTVFQQERDRINSAIDTRNEYNRLNSLDDKSQVKAFVKQFIIKNYHSKNISDPLNIKFDGNAFRFVFLPFLNEDVNTNDDSAVKQAIESHLEIEVERTIEKFRRLKIWNTTDRTKSDYDFEAVSKMGGDASAIRKYIYNSTFMNSQITQFFAGDLAFYKADSNGIVSTDVLKRIKEIWSPASLLNTSDSEGIGDTYTTVYVSDIEKKSQFLTELENGLKMDSTLPVELRRSIISSYRRGIDDETGEKLSGNNITDAQTYITLDRYVKILKSKGAWTVKHEEALKRINANKEIPEDIMIFMTPIKPFMFGHYKIGNRVVPIQNKNSEVPLLPRFVAMSPTLKKISDYLNENNIDSFSFNSVVKVGEFGTTTLTDNIDNLGELHKITLSNINYGIQQEVPAKFLDKEVLFGSQIRRLILSNLDFDGTYIINGKELSGSEIYDKYQQLVSDSVIEGYEKASKNFLDKAGNLNYPVLQRALLKEAYTRGLSSQVLDALQLVTDPETGEKRFKVSLSHPTYSHIFESLLNSIFKNSVIKQKIKGGGMVQVSAFGFSDQVKPVRGEDGKIVAAEVLMPAHTRRFFEGAINEDGSVNMDLLDPSALEGLGYRIPTEDKYSMLPFIIKGFLPIEMGSSIILPEEITTQTGSDFDIDKMFIMLYELEKDKDTGKLKKIASSLDPVSFNFLDNSLIGISKEERNNTIIDIMRGILLSPNSIADELSPGGFSVLQEIAEQIKPYYEEDQKYYYIFPSTQTNFFNRVKSAGGLIGIFANHNVNHIITTLGDVRFSSNVVPNEETKSFASGYITRPNNTKIKVSKVLGSNVAAAVDAIKDPIFNFINVNDSTVNEFVTLERVGVSPDRALFFINNPVIREFSNQVLNFNLLGESVIRDIFFDYMSLYKHLNNIGPEESPDILDQSLQTISIKQIKKDLNYYKNNKSHINTVLSMNPQERSNLSFDKDLSDYIKSQLNQLLIFSDLRNHALSLSKFINITRTESGGPGPSIFDNISKINRISNFYNDKKISLEDTIPVLKDSILAINQMYPDYINDSTVIEAREVEKTFPFVDAFTKYGLIKPTEILFNIFPYNSNLFRNIVYNSKAESTEQIRKIYAAYSTYALSKMPLINNTESDRITELFMGNNNIVKRFVDIRTRYPDIGKSLLFRKISTVISEKDGDINYLKFNNTTKLLPYEKDLIVSDWERLLSHENDEIRIFGEDLIRNSFYTTGYTYSGSAMYNFIPNSVYESQNANRILEDAFPDGILDISIKEVYDFLYQYYRNELNNDDSLIPRLWEAKETEYINKDGKRIPSRLKIEGVQEFDNFVKYINSSGEKNLYFAIDVISREDVYDVTYIRVPSTRRGMRYYNIQESFIDVLKSVTPEEFQPNIGPIIENLQKSTTQANECGL